MNSLMTDALSNYAEIVVSSSGINNGIPSSFVIS